VLLNQIKASAYERAVTEKKIHNFPLALPEHFASDRSAASVTHSVFYLNCFQSHPIHPIHTGVEIECCLGSAGRLTRRTA